MQINDQYSMKLLVQSQTNLESWYAINLNYECCECNDQVHICKHMLVVHMLLDWELKHSRILLSSIEEGLLRAIHDYFEVEAFNQARRLTKNDGLFDNKENNPTCISEPN